ncbi:MAG: PAS domain-containing transcriptional regulator [Rhodospirillum sp.]|nr:PAS domain-containing transcriptional regulator [Rhodospirillum sp.]MCF8491529.1 PAS domain-containing transcriptional regulator [Rhodospirillum sp.]MCF8501409.1 PAS domain-containing transcriptional regulator [Rhodospirillum sp.]
MSDLAYHLRHATTGVILLDDNLTVRGVSGSVLRLLALPPETVLIGQAILALHPPSIRPKVGVMVDAARAGEGPPATTLMVALPQGPVMMRIDALTPESAAAFTLVLTAGTAPAPPPPAPVTASRLKRLPVDDGEGASFLDLATVVHIQADGHYSRAQVGGTSHFCPLSLSEVERRLDPEEFLRVHRSHLVALSHAKAFRKRGDGGQLVMDNGDLVPVGRGHVGHLRALLAV